MTKIVSIVPPSADSKNVTMCQGTKVLLDNGEYLAGVSKITLVAEVDKVWKAIIEVTPTNQGQIDAVLAELKVKKSHEGLSTKEANNLDESGKVELISLGWYRDSRGTMWPPQAVDWDGSSDQPLKDREG